MSKEQESSIRPVIAMAAMFVVTILIAMATTTILPKQYKVFGEGGENNVVNPLIYIVIILVFTGVILLFAKYNLEKLIQFIILGSVSISIVYVFYPPFLLLLGESADNPSGMGALIAVSISMLIAYTMTILLLVYPEWYIVDTTGLFLAIGITAILGFSMGILPLFILLMILAVYDAISVYKTKHMVALADNVVEARLPILLVVPKEKDYSFMEQKPLQEQIDSGEEREAMFMGLGDIIIPGSLTVSAFVYLPTTAFGPVGTNLIVALGTLVGAMCGFAALMYFVQKGKPQAGLPLLNTGAILGYVVTALLVMHNLGLVLPSWLA